MYFKPLKNLAIILRLVSCHGRLKLAVHFAFGERHMALDPPQSGWTVDTCQSTLYHPAEYRRYYVDFAGEQSFRLGSQNPQDNATWGLERVDVPSNIAPGDEATFNFTITAPSLPGTYNFQWRMVEEIVAWFGDTTPNVPVVVQTLLRQLIVHVQPFPVPIGRSVVLTVFAKDAQTSASVAGKVAFNGIVVASTNTPFNYKLPIKRVFDPETKHWIPEPNPPDGEVTAPGYATAHIDFGV